MLLWRRTFIGPALGGTGLKLKNLIFLCYWNRHTPGYRASGPLTQVLLAEFTTPLAAGPLILPEREIFPDVVLLSRPRVLAFFVAFCFLQFAFCILAFCIFWLTLCRTLERSFFTLGGCALSCLSRSGDGFSCGSVLGDIFLGALLGTLVGCFASTNSFSNCFTLGFYNSNIVKVLGNLTSNFIRGSNGSVLSELAG